MSKPSRKAAPKPIATLDVRNFEGRIVDTAATTSEARAEMERAGDARWMTLIDGANHVDRFVRTVKL